MSELNGCNSNNSKQNVYIWIVLRTSYLSQVLLVVYNSLTHRDLVRAHVMRSLLWRSWSLLCWSSSQCYGGHGPRYGGYGPHYGGHGPHYGVMVSVMGVMIPAIGTLSKTPDLGWCIFRYEVPCRSILMTSSWMSYDMKTMWHYPEYVQESQFE